MKQRDDGLAQYLSIGDKAGDGQPVLFGNYSSGVKTQRDAWCYNAGRTRVSENMTQMIAFFNQEVGRFDREHPGLNKQQREAVVDEIATSDASSISWTRSLRQELVKGKRFAFDASGLVKSLYRPFTKQWLYFNRRFNEMVYQVPRLFPATGGGNLVICLNGVGAQKEFSVLRISVIVTAVFGIVTGARL